MLPITTAIAISYLIGSVPTAYIFGRLLKGIDIRQHGSGNVGATNALRILGKGPGITVLVLDILKGVLATVLVSDYALRSGVHASADLLQVMIGIACICGHNWTVFLRFKGGKGIATTLGVLIGLSLRTPGLGLVLSAVLVTWILVFIISRIISLASIAAAVVLPVYMLFACRTKLMLATSIVLSLFVLLRHKANIQRLLQGKEPRLKFRSK